MKTSEIALLGAGALAVVWYVSQPATAANTVAVSSNPVNAALVAAGAPAPPAAFDQTYYLTYQYPAMLLADPNVGNPNYQMTAAEANQYINNYLEVAEWLPTQVPKLHPTNQAAAQFHFSTYGVPYKYTFLPLVPPKTAPYVGPPPAPASSGKGSSVFGDVLSAVSVAAAAAAPYAAVLLAGVSVTPLLNDTEVAILFNGAPLIKNMLPMFYSDSKAFDIEDELNDLLKQYS